MLKVSQTIIKAIISNQTKIYGGAISPGWDIKKQVEENYSEDRANKDFEEIKKHIRVNKSNKILDVGCGYGFFVATLQHMGYQCYGYDVDQASVKIAKQLLKENNLNPKLITLSDDNNISYPPETFDLVNLNYVLLYVQNWQALFREISKVLKKDGKIYLITPNYQCGYDVNYGLPLLYFLPRSINKLYLKLMGRKNTAFFECFNFTTKRKIEGFLSRNNFSFVDIGIKKWLAFKSSGVEGRSDAYKILVKTVEKLHLEIILLLMAKLGFYTPLIYIVEKNDKNIKKSY